MNWRLGAPPSARGARVLRGQATRFLRLAQPNSNESLHCCGRPCRPAAILGNRRRRRKKRFGGWCAGWIFRLRTRKSGWACCARSSGSWARADVIRNPCQPFAFLPEAPGRRVVLRLFRGRSRLALVEIKTVSVGHLGRRGDINDGLSSLLWGDGEHLGRADSQGEQAAALVAELCGHKAGMKAIGIHARACPASRKFACKKDVAQL